MWKSRIWFLVKFLAAAGVLFGLWAAGGMAEVYAKLVLRSVAVLSPWTTGYEVEVASAGGKLAPYFTAAGTRLAMPLNLRESLIGVMAFLALVAASWPQPLARFVKAAASGVGILYAVHVAVVTMLPLMVTPHAKWLNDVIDVAFVFSALGGLVALPFLLWFILMEPAASLRRVANRGGGKRG